jgi:hypothetical protein
MRFQRQIVFLLSLCWAPSIVAADTSLNPDRWVHLDFQASGTYDLQRNPDVTSKGITYTRDVNGHSAEMLMNFLVPLNNYWSIAADAGTTSSLSSASETPVTTGTNSDSAVVNGLVTARYYFVHRALYGAPPPQNPDRWPSAGLSVSGAHSFYDQSTETSGVNTTIRNDNFSQSMTLTADTRLPTSDAVTWLASVGGTIGASQTAEATSVQGNDEQGTENRSDSISASLGWRYYWVGKNCIRNDVKRNPDEWTSLAFTASGTDALSDRQVITSKAKPTDERDVDSKSASGTLELRLPVTNSLTVRVGITGGVNRTDLPQTALNAGSTVLQPTLGGFAALRGYFN